MVKQLAHKSHLDARFWALSWLHAVEVRNRFPRAGLKGKSPAIADLYSLLVVLTLVQALVTPALLLLVQAF